MNYKEALDYIHSLTKFGSKPGLSRITELLNLLDNPQNDIECVHIAGTNGKGSVSTMISSALISSGKKTGLYISPYIIDFRERIQINGEYIEKEELAELTSFVKLKAEQIKDTPTEFEFITALMFLYFKKKKVDIAVLETGLGGRLDATNVINPKAVVITKISKDHTEVLGNTLTKIAFEKAGIIKDRVPVIISPNQTDEALQEIIRIAKLKNSPIYVCNTEKQYMLKLIGPYQQENAAAAVKCLEILNVPKENILNGLYNAFIPARLEKISNNPEVYIDGAHNVDGALALKNHLRGNPVLILGMMRDKDVDEVIHQLAPMCKLVITVKVESNLRSETAENLAKKASLWTKAIAAENYKQALNLAKENSNGEMIIIGGSLYLASDIIKIAKKFFNPTT